MTPLVRHVPPFDVETFRPRSTAYCVVIPVLNEGHRIRAQLARMKPLAATLDVVVADGGSTDDGTDSLYLRACGVTALLTKRGEGKLGAQLRMAFSWALDQGYDGVITVDGNGKDGVDAIPSFVAALEAGYDFVQGSRFLPDGHHENTPLSRLVAIRTIHAPAVSAIAGIRYTDTTNGFRAHSAAFMSDPRVALFRDIFQGYELLPYLAVRAARLGFRVKELPVSRCYPRREPTPTKLHGTAAKVDLIQVLLRLATGRYNPAVNGKPKV